MRRFYLIEKNDLSLLIYQNNVTLVEFAKIDYLYPGLFAFYLFPICNKCGIAIRDACCLLLYKYLVFTVKEILPLESNTPQDIGFYVSWNSINLFHAFLYYP